MRARNPQLTLRLDAVAPAGVIRWCEGARLPYLGGEITLHLARDGEEPVLHGDVLHLPLPPEASPRQIQDRTEAWLQTMAQARFSEIITRHTERCGTIKLPCVLSFATKANWVSADDTALRCNRKLIEQSPTTIEQVIATAVAGLPLAEPVLDLFGHHV